MLLSLSHRHLHYRDHSPTVYMRLIKALFLTFLRYGRRGHPLRGFVRENSIQPHWHQWNIRRLSTTSKTKLQISCKIFIYQWLTSWENPACTINRISRFRHMQATRIYSNSSQKLHRNKSVFHHQKSSLHDFLDGKPHKKGSICQSSINQCTSSKKCKSPRHLILFYLLFKMLISHGCKVTSLWEPATYFQSISHPGRFRYLSTGDAHQYIPNTWEP